MRFLTKPFFSNDSHSGGGGALEGFYYDNKVVKAFMIAAVIFGVVGMLVGLTAATQLFWPTANLGIPFTSFGRIRPLHTNAIIFAFVGNAMFGGVYYSLPRLLKTPMFNRTLSWVHFWGWQLIIVAAALSLPLGFTTGKEYAELEWPIDIAIALVWVVFGINMIGTIITRRERHMYVAVWFYISTFITVAMLHIVNSFELPLSFTKSYSLYAGVQDALVQWWYGHNAVAFFLTTPFLGLMYYFMPKAANRPVFSYKLSIIHFWSLIFLYIWAGPHHLLYSSLPDWAQSLGTVFSVMLIAPSWGGMLNGLLTLRGAWDRVREDPVLKFFVVAVTAYGMATFEGPMLSLKNVNAISHFTDWTILSACSSALAIASLANTHFWIGTLGILFWTLPMYWAGFTQSLMWKEFTKEGFLAYPNFLETVTQLIPLYAMRAFGGLLYLIGTFIMIYNLIKTAGQGSFVADEYDEAPALVKNVRVVGEGWHSSLERKPVFFMVLALVAVIIGGVVEFVPTWLVESNIPTIASVKPYTPLELEGRDIYIREGCYTCHSQMIRPFRSETERYGEYSKAGEFVYDHPFQWGSKRTGPDLHRVGGKYPDSWHYNHMMDPQTMSPGSIMPTYPWLLSDKYNKSLIPNKISVMRKLGVPYPEGFEDEAIANAEEQADKIVKSLADAKITTKSDREIVALIAYLQRLGTDIKKEQTASK